MSKDTFTITWNNNQFYSSKNVFSPKESTLGICEEIEYTLSNFNQKVPIIDLCCGIGAIGISAYIKFPDSFNFFLGLDNDKESISICKSNIDLHKIFGEAKVWNASEKIPLYLSKGIVVCNPPFIPLNYNLNDNTYKKSLVYSNNNGLEILLNCFDSLKSTDHFIIVKSLRKQVSNIHSQIKDNFVLIRKKNYKLDDDYEISFTTWQRK